jgi:EF-P beta-lysylation protein EpmB
MSSSENSQLKARMIPRTAALWEQSLASAFTDPQALLRYLQLDPALASGIGPATDRFRMLVPQGFAALMEKGNPDDPLLRQVLPLAEELRETAGYSTDPVGDGAATRSPGLLQKYPGRALLVTTGACAVHCRYCFRRHFPYREGIVCNNQWQSTLHTLRAEPSISEVILSGGDPLMLPDEALEQMIRDLEQIPHLSSLRIHSRLPIVLPERCTDRLLAILNGSRLRPLLVIHCNHARELGNAARETLALLRQSGLILLNQSVLLKGVNDSSASLCDLSEALFNAGVLPYYVHLLDRVRGAAHFEVTPERARVLQNEIRERLPGYLVPRFVFEQPGRKSKLPLDYQQP